MKIFLSAVEGAAPKPALQKYLEQPDNSFLWNLMSYFYCRKAAQSWIETIRDRSQGIMIDSGAHSFQKGAKVSWEDYTHEFARWIKQFDRENVVGYFEMDVDNILGYDRVQSLREILKSESGVPHKIIPVWHKNRGITEFKKMCDECAGHTVAITGFKNEDIKDDQYGMFVKEAWNRGCKIHCLGMTRKDVLNKVPFDYTDSSSWLQMAVYGKIGRRKVTREFSKTNRNTVYLQSYLEAMKMQRHYYRRWRKVNND